MHQINCVNDLIQFANTVQGQSGLRWWYRGHSRASYQLLPTALRSYTPEQERFLTNEFRARAATRHSSVPAKDDFAGWLSLMQHYGLPTRLLDWTFSPLIAAFFAVTATQQTVEDASIWGLAPSRLNELYKLDPYLYPLDALKLHVDLEPAFRTKRSSDRIVAAMAIEADPRMQMQQGAFTVHSSRVALCAHQDTSSWLQKAVVPKDSIRYLRQELKLLSIRRDSVFPDLGALAEQLKADLA